MKSWINREIEYRSYQSLSKDSSCFRGRIVKIYPYGYALCQVTYQTSLDIDSKDINRNLSGLSYFRKKHHKRIYRYTGFKYPWKKVNEVVHHIVKWSGTRWKNVIITDGFKWGLEQDPYTINNEDCDCAKCDSNYQQEYQKWHSSIEVYIKEHNLHEFDQMILWSHPPDHLLRLPCKKGK